MIRAVIREGHIEPLDRLPAEWSEGQELTVEVRDLHPSSDSIRDWYADWKATCSDFTPETQAELDQALEAIRQEGKDQMRKEMGL